MCNIHEHTCSRITWYGLEYSRLTPRQGKLKYILRSTLLEVSNGIASFEKRLAQRIA